VAKEEELMGVSEMKNRSNDIAIGMVKGISKVGITNLNVAKRNAVPNTIVKDSVLPQNKYDIEKVQFTGL
jgi:hypothetical protein